MIKFPYGGGILNTSEFYTVIYSFASIAIAILGIYLSHKSKSLSTYEKQLTEVYSPLFIAFEPYLYKQITLETAKQLSSLLDATIIKHHVLCNPILIERASTFKEVINSNTTYQLIFKDICLHMDRYYDKLRKNINLPIRNTTYRFYKDQFSNKWSAGFYIFYIVTSSLLRFLLTLLAVLTLLGAALNLLSPLLQSLSIK